jgi:site-specific recombinase XerC
MKTRLAPGIFEDAYGRVVRLPGGVRKQSRDVRFPKGTSLERLIAWRATQTRQQATAGGARACLTRDIVKYLKRLKGLPGYASEKSHLRAWAHLFGAKPRHALTRDQVEFALGSWREQGYATRTIRHRVRVLLALYNRFDGSRAITPLDDVPLPRKPKPNPSRVGDRLIADVALELRKHEVLGLLRDSKTRARFLVRATCPPRPCQIKWAEPGDVDLERRTWRVRSAKGGPGILLPLNENQVAAWALFIAADAWGAFDSSSFCKTLHRCGWPAGVSPYNMRHSIAFALDDQEVSRADISTMFQHGQEATTQHYYKPGQRKQLAAASKAIGDRFSATMFAPAKPAAAKREEEEAPARRRA